MSDIKINQIRIPLPCFIKKPHGLGHVAVLREHSDKPGRYLTMEVYSTNAPSGSISVQSVKKRDALMILGENEPSTAEEFHAAYDAALAVITSEAKGTLD